MRHQFNSLSILLLLVSVLSAKCGGGLGVTGGTLSGGTSSSSITASNIVAAGGTTNNGTNYTFNDLTVNGGNIIATNITGGAALNGGSLDLTGGMALDSSGNGGNLNLTGGAGQQGAGGNVNIQAGSYTTGVGDHGNVNIGTTNTTTTIFNPVFFANNIRGFVMTNIVTGNEEDGFQTNLIVSFNLSDTGENIYPNTANSLNSLLIGDRNSTDSDHTFIFGSLNSISNGAEYSVVFGSGNVNNRQHYSVIAGGTGNTIQDGLTGGDSVIAGGAANLIKTPSPAGTIGGGENNTVSGAYGVVPGGRNNEAGTNSFAAGFRAKAYQAGTFVISDNQNADFPSVTTNEFAARYLNGYRLTGGKTTVSSLVTTISNTLAPSSITFPATTVNWTNTTVGNIFVFVDNTGVTGSAIKVNGAQIFGSVFVLDFIIPLQVGEYFSETYTIGTPTAKIKPY